MRLQLTLIVAMAEQLVLTVIIRRAVAVALLFDAVLMVVDGVESSSVNPPTVCAYSHHAGGKELASKARSNYLTPTEVGKPSFEPGVATRHAPKHSPRKRNRQFYQDDGKTADGHRLNGLDTDDDAAEEEEEQGILREQHLIDNSTLRCAKSTDFCYTLWMQDPNDKNAKTILFQGCWESSGEYNCIQPTCISNGKPMKAINNSKFCCCSGLLCNNNFVEGYPVEDETNRQPSESVQTAIPFMEPVNGPHQAALIILLAALSLAVFMTAVLITMRRLWSGLQKPSPDAMHLMESSQTPSSASGCGGRGLGTPGLEWDSLKLIQVIGRGRYGQVWRAVMGDNTEVAVKVFPQSHRNYYLNEQDIYCLPFMDHGCLLKYFGSEERISKDSWPEYYLVLSYAPLGCLQDYLRANIIDWNILCRMCQTVAKGLAHLHADFRKGDKVKPCISHRDLNTRNILVKTDLSCVLCDLGFAMKISGSKYYNQCGEEHHAETTSLTDVGTLRYMAPEVLEGAVNLRDCESSLKQIDVYAMGLILWEVATRCSDLYQGLEVPEYRMPFEAEIGLHPSFEQMQVLVSRNKARPLFPEVWKDSNQAVRLLKETIEDCWDQDAEARLTALCVEERLQDLPILWERHKASISGAPGVSPTVNPTSVHSSESGISTNCNVLSGYHYTSAVTSRSGRTNCLDGINCARSGFSANGDDALLVSGLDHTSDIDSHHINNNCPCASNKASHPNRESSTSEATVETMLTMSPCEPTASITVESVQGKNAAAVASGMNQTCQNSAQSKIMVPLQPYQGRNPCLERNMILETSDEVISVSGNQLLLDRDSKKHKGIAPSGVGSRGWNWRSIGNDRGSSRMSLHAVENSWPPHHSYQQLPQHDDGAPRSSGLIGSEVEELIDAALSAAGDTLDSNSLMTNDRHSNYINGSTVNGSSNSNAVPLGLRNSHPIPYVQNAVHDSLPGSTTQPKQPNIPGNGWSPRNAPTKSNRFFSAFVGKKEKKSKDFPSQSVDSGRHNDTVRASQRKDGVFKSLLDWFGAVPSPGSATSNASMSCNNATSQCKSSTPASPTSPVIICNPALVSSESNYNNREKASLQNSHTCISPREGKCIQNIDSDVNSCKSNLSSHWESCHNASRSPKDNQKSPICSLTPVNMEVSLVQPSNGSTLMQTTILKPSSGENNNLSDIVIPAWKDSNPGSLLAVKNGYSTDSKQLSEMDFSSSKYKGSELSDPGLCSQGKQNRLSSSYSSSAILQTDGAHKMNGSLHPARRPTSLSLRGYLKSDGERNNGGTSSADQVTVVLRKPRQSTDGKTKIEQRVKTPFEIKADRFSLYNDRIMCSGGDVYLSSQSDGNSEKGNAKSEASNSQKRHVHLSLSVPIDINHLLNIDHERLYTLNSTTESDIVNPVGSTTKLPLNTALTETTTVSSSGTESTVNTEVNQKGHVAYEISCL